MSGRILSLPDFNSISVSSKGENADILVRKWFASGLSIDRPNRLDLIHRKLEPYRPDADRISIAMNLVWRGKRGGGTENEREFNRLMAACESMFGYGMEHLAAFSVVQRHDPFIWELRNALNWKTDIHDTVCDYLRIFRDAFGSTSSWDKYVGVMAVINHFEFELDFAKLGIITNLSKLWDEFGRDGIVDAGMLHTMGFGFDEIRESLYNDIDIETMTAIAKENSRMERL